MICDLVPPTSYPPIAVMGNYEPENNGDDLVCPFCRFPSGWDFVLWVDNIPEQGLFCNNCHQSFNQSDLENE